MKIKFTLILILFCVVTIFFNKYAIEINNFNAKLRLFIKTGEFINKTFNSDDILIQKSPRNDLGNYTSPFYIVHYALLDSEKFSKNFNGKHWKFTTTLDKWPNVKYKSNIQTLKNRLNWLVNNLEVLNNNYHFIYKFNWNYKGYYKNKLFAPWYSGLTDGYAIILFLRAYDIFKDPVYLDVATKLYNSTISHYTKGGSLTSLNDNPWIEEYVQPGVNEKDMSYVLNGMIYSSYGIIAYEDYFKLKSGLGNSLILSIIENLDNFVLNKYWSYYDQIGTQANLKYHRIHVYLLDEIKNNFKFNVLQKKK